LSRSSSLLNLAPQARLALVERTTTAMSCREMLLGQETMLGQD
jgi:hypothetical protein